MPIRQVLFQDINYTLMIHIQSSAGRHWKENLIGSIWFAINKFNSLWPLFGAWGVSIYIEPLKGSKVFLVWVALCCHTKLSCCNRKLFGVLFYNQFLQPSRTKKIFLLKHMINLHNKTENSRFTAFVSKPVPVNSLKNFDLWQFCWFC